MPYMYALYVCLICKPYECMCICIHMHAYILYSCLMHVNMYVCMYVYIYTYLQPYIHTCMHACIHTCIHTHTHTKHTHTHTHTHMHAGHARHHRLQVRALGKRLDPGWQHPGSPPPRRTPSPPLSVSICLSLCGSR